MTLSVIISLYLWFKRSRTSRKKDLCYYRVGDDMDFSRKNSYPLMPIMSDISKENNYFLKENCETFDFLIFETLNDVDNNMCKIPAKLNGINFIYGVCGSDLMSSKSMLAIILRGEGYEDIIPKTYVVPDDMQKFKDEYVDNGIAYILKKNIQRQEGVKIFADYEEILKNANNYVVIQQLLQDPFIVGGRKVNMRVYMLVHVDKNAKCTMYIYDDGFMYYTPGKWSPGSILAEDNITTGYIDRQVYVENPLTIQDFGKHVGPQLFDVFWKNLIETMTKVRKAYSNRLSLLNKQHRSNCFLVYGIDIAPNKDLKCQIMEVNKGPDLTYKDERDKNVKYNMMKSALSIVGVLPYKGDDSKFIRI